MATSPIKHAIVLAKALPHATIVVNRVTFLESVHRRRKNGLAINADKVATCLANARREVTAAAVAVAAVRARSVTSVARSVILLEIVAKVVDMEVGMEEVMAVVAVGMEAACAVKRVTHVEAMGTCQETVPKVKNAIIVS